MTRKYFIVTFGCQANEADSRAIADIFEKYGCEQALSKKDCDFLVFNTCSIRQKAEDRIFGLNANLRKLKQNNRNLKIILTGCMTHYSEKELQSRLQPFDFFLPIGKIKLLPKLLKLTKPKRACVRHRVANIITALIPISSGCDNFCSYCIVPYSRGREISRPIKDIIRDAKFAVNQPNGKGAKEIWLLGQNVNSYNDKTAEAIKFFNSRCGRAPDLQSKSGRVKELKNFDSKAINFSDILRSVNSLPGEFWIRFTSPHPKDFSDDLIKAMTECEKFTHYVNLPVQSGNNKILKKMNRPYNVGHYKKIIKKLRAAMPDIAISTDVIVGFPGETKKQFQDTIKLFEEIKFDMAFISEYSPRSKTLAAKKFKDNISHKEKENRKNILNEILIKTALEHNQKLVGQTITILNYRTAGNKLVKIMDKNYKPNKFTQVKITKATPWSLTGKLL